MIEKAPKRPLTDFEVHLIRVVTDLSGGQVQLLLALTRLANDDRDGAGQVVPQIADRLDATLDSLEKFIAAAAKIQGDE